MAGESDPPKKGWLPRMALGQAFGGIALIVALAAAFFVFYVAPQSQYERDRIYRSMNDVSRLLDDKVQAAAQTFQSWDCTRNATGQKACYDNLDARLDDIERETQDELPGFAFGCAGKNIVCLKPKTPKTATEIAKLMEKPLTPALSERAERIQQVSITLQSIAQGARLPYPGAILLIMNPSGQVVAGYDEDGKWLQFQSLTTLIDKSRVEPAKAGSSDDFTALLAAAQRSGRGAENLIFEGYPARMSRNMGGQGYSIFMAAHELGRIRTGAIGAAGDKTQISVSDPQDGVARAGSGTATPQSGAATASGASAASAANAASPPRPKDILYFAYIIPDGVIDGAALRVPPDWTVDLLLVLVCALLSIPFLKLFNSSPLKAICVTDLAAILVSIMLIVTTVTLLLTAVLLRNSIGQDIGRELAHVAKAVSETVADQAGHLDRAQLEDYVVRGIDRGAKAKAAKTPLPPWTLTGATEKEQRAQLVDLAPLQSSFIISERGLCDAKGGAQCGEGVWFNQMPLPGQLNIADRTYFKVWRNSTPGDKAGQYVQFLRSKANGKLSWSYIVDATLPELKTVAGKAGQQAPARPSNGAAPAATAGSGRAEEPLRTLPPLSTDAAAPKRRGLVVSAMPLALRAPVLARNFSFMIVLNTDLPETLRSQGSEVVGDVQYHSDQPRSLIENVLREARDEPRLTAALKTMHDSDAKDDLGRAIPINYHGRNHFAFVQPIPGMPLSVIALFDRTEAQALFAQSVAQAFFLCCCWILICLLVCWGTPRAMRWMLPSSGPRPAMPLRARSLWFFPNGLFPEGEDGFIFAAQARWQEGVLLVLTLGVQAWAFLWFPTGQAVLVMALVSLVALIFHYLLIARPSAATQTKQYLAGFAAAVIFAMLLYAALTKDVPLGWLSAGALLLVVLLIAAYFYLLKKGGQEVPAPRSEFVEDMVRIRAIRNAFLLRAIIHLLVVVAIPAVGFMTFIYGENLKGYVGASLITAAERIAEQRTLLRHDVEQRFSAGKPTPAAETKAMSAILDGYGLEGFGYRPPGWFISTSDAPLSGLFSLCTAKCTSLPPTRSGNRIIDFLEAMTPHYAEAMSEARDSAERVELVRDAGKSWVRLARPRNFVPPGSSLGPEGETMVLAAGPMETFALHPERRVWIPALLFFALFCVAFYCLIRSVAAHLTGLYLTPSKDAKAARDELGKRIDSDVGAVWAELRDRDKEACSRLIALAYGRTINFRDRAPIQKMIKEGWLELTPYVRIAHPRLKEFLRYDLPRAERDAILREASGPETDYWDRMRAPVFVALGAACLLLAYTSPDAIQLIMSAFLAFTALLPLAQDPISRFLGTQRS